jgi:glycosyltransferase involved in cell wall biosynthesis
MVDFSVAICTFNGEKRLPAVLDRLKSCCEYTDKNDKIYWEILVIDNNSKDNTAQVFQDYQANWPEAYPLKYYFEPKQGLSFARQLAIQEARGKFVGFLDDDNLPSPNWVTVAYAFGNTNPKAGAYGGKIEGDFEISPPQNFERISRFLAIGGGEKLVCYTSSEYKYSYKRVLPPGAGLVIRKQAWLESVPEELLFRGRVDASLVTAEDIEALLHIRKTGWEIWYNPEMQIAHRIPKNRLEKEYLIKLMRGIGLSRYHTRMLGFPAWQRIFVFPIYMANDLKKIILHFIKHRSVLKTDVVSACEMELFIGSFISPLYIWSRYFLKFKKLFNMQSKSVKLTHNKARNRGSL